MTLTQEALEDITRSVWASVLESDLRVAPSSSVESVCGPWVGAIRLDGAFDGWVTLHLDEALLRGAASTLFDVAVQSVDESQLRDTAAELTNILGGNIKSLVDQPTRLALPEVVTPTTLPSLLKASQPCTCLTLASPSGDIAVVVHETRAA